MSLGVLAQGERGGCGQRQESEQDGEDEDAHGGREPGGQGDAGKVLGAA